MVARFTHRVRLTGPVKRYAGTFSLLLIVRREQGDPKGPLHQLYVGNPYVHRQNKENPKRPQLGDVFFEPEAV